MVRLLLALLVTVVTLAPAMAAPVDDVRLLVDVSGSMKQNDPGNLRAPALRLFVNLLPSEAAAGIWLFSSRTETLAAPSPVSATWQDRALAGSGDIHSSGQHTDIATAIETALGGWETATDGAHRSLVLLTDGMVDISAEPDANAAARERILTELVPRLRRLGVSVYTIALSENADRDFLHRLAIGTGGTLTVAESAHDLQRIFLQLFERTVERQSTPLTDGGFHIDASVRELTLLVFDPPNDEAIRLIPPGDAAFARTDAPANVRWLAEPGYHLITVEQPKIGHWQLLGTQDPANRVMIVTDLELRVDRLPNRVLAGETLPLRARVVEKGKTITRRAFLDLVDIRVTTGVPAAPSGEQRSLRDQGRNGDRQAGDGVFTLEIVPRADGPDQLAVLTRVDGGTFGRENRQLVQVSTQPLAVEKIAPTADDPGALLIRPRTPWLVEDSIRLVARIPGPDGSVDTVEIDTQGAPPWRVPLAGLAPGRTASIDIRLQAQARSGRRVAAALPPISLTVPDAPPSEPEPVAEPEIPAEDPSPVPEPGVNWMLVIAVVIAANALILAGAAGGWMLVMRRRQKRDTPAPAEDIEEAETLA